MADNESYDMKMWNIGNTKNDPFYNTGAARELPSEGEHAPPCAECGHRADVHVVAQMRGDEGGCIATGCDCDEYKSAARSPVGDAPPPACSNCGGEKVILSDADGEPECVWCNAPRSELQAHITPEAIKQVARMLEAAYGKAVINHVVILLAGADRIATLTAENERRTLPPHVASKIVRELDRQIAAEAEQFQPGRQHHNGPRRLTIELDTHHAELLRASLSEPTP